MSTAKSRPYQLGDTVHILETKIVRRVGYPIHFQDLDVRDAVRAALTPEVLTSITGVKSRAASFAFLDAACKEYVLHNGFGGNLRSIHYFPVAAPVDDPHFLDQPPSNHKEWMELRTVPDCTGKVAKVRAKCVRKTGKRYAPLYGSALDEYDYEPGGLSDERTHVMLYIGGYGWIEQCHVELVDPVPALDGQIHTNSPGYRI